MFLHVLSIAQVCPSLSNLIAGFSGFRRANLYRLTEITEKLFMCIVQARNKKKSETQKKNSFLLSGMNSPPRQSPKELSTNSAENCRKLKTFSGKSDGEIIINCDIFIGSVSGGKQLGFASSARTELSYRSWSDSLQDKHNIIFSLISARFSCKRMMENIISYHRSRTGYQLKVIYDCGWQEQIEIIHQRG